MRGNHWSVAGRSWALAPMLLLAGLAFSGTTALAEESAGPLQVFSVGDTDFTDQNSNGPYLGATPMRLAGMTGAASCASRRASTGSTSGRTGTRK